MSEDNEFQQFTTRLAKQLNAVMEESCSAEFDLFLWYMPNDTSERVTINKLARVSVTTFKFDCSGPF